jgi:geranylgeranyl pyrophosphate synthase
MRQSLQAPALEGAARPPWLRLPLLCCQAAGGDPALAEPAAAAWALLYAAAHLLDSVQDGDPPEPWWEALGPGPASNVATGLIAATALVLTSGSCQPAPDRRLLEDFFRTVLRMCSAQHLDLTRSSAPLEDCWRMAEAKSGAFFGLACRSGARAAGIDEPRLSHYSSYGTCLGLLIQIGDDLSDLSALGTGTCGRGRLALPLAYCRSVDPPTAGRALPPHSAEGERQLLDVLESTGASLYLAARVHQLRRAGAGALQLAAEPSASVDSLLELIESTPRAL